MLVRLFRIIFNIILFVGLPSFSYFSVYRATDRFFQATDQPLPFHLFGVAYGLGAASWAIAAGLLILMVIKLLGRKKASPGSVKEIQKMSEVEILK